MSRWLNLLDITLEKEKGPIIGKSRVTQLHKAESQLLMRIYVGGRNDNNVEKDSRLSQFNCGLRRHYSIDAATFQKRLMHSNAVRDGKQMMHNLSDFKACCNQ